MQEWDSEDEEEEVGMAARTLLQTIPGHRLKALESLQADANEVNAAVKVSLPHPILGQCRHELWSTVVQTLSSELLPATSTSKIVACTSWTCRPTGECSAAHRSREEASHSPAHHGWRSSRKAHIVWARRDHPANDGEGDTIFRVPVRGS